jgi:glycerophosphoryl diester phosphodiesterase
MHENPYSQATPSAPPRARSLAVSCAHRGASSEAPENTFAAFRLAVEQQARMLEFDVRLSLDGHPVVVHDHELTRTSNGQGKVEETDLATLRGLDVGSWFDAGFAGERMPLLEEVLDFGKTHNLGLDIELKFSNSHWAPLCDAVGTLLTRRGLDPGVFVTSFNHRALHYLKTRFPHVPIARLYATGVPRERNLRFDPNPSVAMLRHLISPALVYRVHSLQGAVYAWTVDDPAEMRRLILMGVDVIMSNKPALLASVLQACEAEAAQVWDPGDDLDEDAAELMFAEQFGHL